MPFPLSLDTNPHIWNKSEDIHFHVKLLNKLNWKVMYFVCWLWVKCKQNINSISSSLLVDFCFASCDLPGALYGPSKLKKKIDRFEWSKNWPGPELENISCLYLPYERVHLKNKNMMEIFIGHAQWTTEWEIMVNGMVN